MNNINAIAALVIKELYRRKDFYVLFILTALITLVAGSINFFNEDRIVRYVREICLLLIWVSTLVVAVTLAARHIPMERESRTIFPLLAKPITRREVVLGKFLGCWLACGIALVVFYVFFGAVSMAKDEGWRGVQYAQAMWLHWVMLGVVTAMTVLGSIVFAAPSSTNTIVLIVTTGILLLGRHLSKVAAHLAEPQQTLLLIVYYAIPHLEFYDVRDLIIHEWPPIDWSVIGLATLYGAAYAAFFLAVAVLAFHRKPLST